MNYVFLIFWISLTVSQSAMDLMSTVIVFWGLLLFIKNKKKDSFNLRIGLEKLWVPWLFIFFLGILTQVPIENIHWTQWSEMKWILLLYSFVLFYTFQRPWLHPRLLTVFCIYLSFASGWATLSYFLKYDFILQQPIGDPNRVGGFFDDPMGFAHVYGLFFTFLFIQLLEKAHQASLAKSHSVFAFIKTHYLALLTLTITGVALILSLTRGIWMGATVACLLSAFLISRKWGWISLMGALSLIGILLVSWPMFSERIFFVLNSTNNYDGERMWLWKSNWQMFLDHPLLGVGYGEYKQWLPIYFENLGAPIGQRFLSHAHNQYLHLFANTGFFGGLFYIIFISFMFAQTFRIYKKVQGQPIASWVIGSFAAQICFAIGGLSECNFERAKMRLTYLALAAIPFAIQHHLKLQQDTK